ncbi:hypothetical protein WJX81_001282 [Elliptochloris bilobata]|uniref:Uncharacterized protein n=1 Tax=Elliptochloris bilobata TaxID=381761 RepID=A0AAW1S3Y8_9CHLO
MAPRFTAVSYHQLGLSDLTSCIITAFAFSLLTRRAFILRPFDNMRIQDGMGMPNFDWSAIDIANLSIINIAHFNTGGDEPLSPYAKDFRTGNVSTIGENFDVVNFQDCNYGATYHLTENPYHKSTLARMGLRPDTIFGCLFDYLFSPLPEVLRIFERELAVMRDTSTLKIAIQIRTGDEAMLARDMDDSEGALSKLLWQHRAYFMCAHQIQMERAVNGQKVVWLLVTDNEQLRHAAALRFPDLVLTNLKR